MELNCAVMIMCVGSLIYDLHRYTAKSRLCFAAYLRDDGNWDLRWSCSLTILFASCYRQCALYKSGVVGRQLTDVEHMCESGLEVPSRVNALMSSSQLCFVAIHFHR